MEVSQGHTQDVNNGGMGGHLSGLESSPGASGGDEMGGEAGPHTFLTHVGADPDVEQDGYKKLYELGVLVDKIDTQFETVLQNHEKDFRAAYEGHMTKVKKELIHLRAKRIEAAGKVSNDDNITGLQR